MQPFPALEIEGVPYPSVVMGEDNFSGWFGKGIFPSEEERANAYRAALDAAYACGVRGFSVSPQETQIATLCAFKREHPEIICIANPHWQRNYYVGDESLWRPENLKRLTATIHRLFPALPDTTPGKNSEHAPFSDAEIASFRIDEREYRENLAALDFCDFALIGNLGYSALLLLGRDDLLRAESALARERGMVPILMCQGGGLALERMSRVDVGGCWLWLNKHYSFPTREHALDALQRTDVVVTAYKIFDSPHGFDLASSVEFLKEALRVRSLVVGVENATQAKETFTRLHEHWP